MFMLRLPRVVSVFGDGKADELGVKPGYRLVHVTYGPDDKEELVSPDITDEELQQLSQGPMFQRPCTLVFDSQVEAGAESQAQAQAQAYAQAQSRVAMRAKA